MNRLTGKVAIVTGAGSRGPGLGNGKATAILFAREGARVLCVDQVAARAEETVALIRAEGGEAAAHAADVTRAAECDGMVAAALDRWGGLDILHNNVGVESRKDLALLYCRAHVHQPCDDAAADAEAVVAFIAGPDLTGQRNGRGL